MELLITVLAAVLLLLAVALMAAAGGRGRLASDHHALVCLSRVRGPSGQSFFPNDDAVWELSDAMEPRSEEAHAKFAPGGV
jgi:hypothetical protein